MKDVPKLCHKKYPFVKQIVLLCTFSNKCFAQKTAHFYGKKC